MTTQEYDKEIKESELLVKRLKKRLNDDSKTIREIEAFIDEAYHLGLCAGRMSERKERLIVTQQHDDNVKGHNE